MVVLNLPKAELSIKSKENKQFIFDIIRKKNMVLTPEEWVRQHVVHYLINHLNYPKSIIAVEKQLTINTLKKRFDILVFNTKGNPEIIIECKAPKVKITQDTFDQIARYNLNLNAKYLMVTNGLNHYFCQMDSENEKYVFLEALPYYSR
ncbi:type I restriction enzyme HsdR N-terminal domain-containing protein [Aureibaculum sp. A20]|uniref:Type I restriction enzyme HsdR N-terminal domain-containing protein n=1 Tax=Aureibaculum flavum TaxID=2795986 RepID=A0ABS0WL84_9FLAO|nr:type I restriction enzyme HsdR N-terminal domain-containing protein [Aureibaculum flavum]MBJ2172718.1 type I restriction enzyme HsdR N-terminal domain-containing protein [Aureibaculum flavum]